jgi:hypothetical protein
MMADQEDSAVRGIQKRFRDFSIDVREERVIRYMIRQLRNGRRHDDILEDPYVVANTSAAARDRLIQHPMILEAIEEEIKREFSDYHSAGPASSHGRPETD